MILSFFTGQQYKAKEHIGIEFWFSFGQDGMADDQSRKYIDRNHQHKQPGMMAFE